MTAARPALLLVEEAFVLRRTVALTARDLDIADVHEAASPSVALRLLAENRFNGLLLALQDEPAGLALIRQVRAGQTRAPANAAIAVMVEHCSADDIARLRGEQIQRIVIKPYKVKTLLEVLQVLAA